MTIFLNIIQCLLLVIYQYTNIIFGEYVKRLPDLPWFNMNVPREKFDQDKIRIKIKWTFNSTMPWNHIKVQSIWVFRISLTVEPVFKRFLLVNFSVFNWINSCSTFQSNTVRWSTKRAAFNFWKTWSTETFVLYRTRRSWSWRTSCATMSQIGKRFTQPPASPTTTLWTTTDLSFWTVDLRTVC